MIKRIALMLCLLILTASVFIGCNKPIKQPVITIDLETVESMPKNRYYARVKDLVYEKESIIELTSKIMKDYYNIPSADNYKIEFVENQDLQCSDIIYTIYIGEYMTFETYNFNVSSSGEIQGRAVNRGKYTRYLPYITNEKLQEASKKIDEKAKKYNTEGSRSVVITQTGDLCLNCEIIVKIDPPNVQIIDGEEIRSGCGIDHDHIFFNEVIVSSVSP